MINACRVLKELRIEHRKTQDYMAQKLNISQSQYNKIERGEKSMEINTVIITASVFNMQPIDLFKMMFGVKNNAHKITNDGNIEHKVIDENHYKDMAKHFEARFLKVYKLYIEICIKYNHQQDIDLNVDLRLHN